MKEKIRILHVITTLDVGGAENMLLKLVSHSDPTFQHRIVYLKGPGKLVSQFKNLPIPPSPLHLEKKSMAIGRLRRFFQSVKGYQPHIIQTWLYHADLLGWVAGIFAHTPLTLWNVRCSYIDFSEYSLTSRLVFKLLTVLSSLPTGIIFNSEKGRNIHQRAGYRAKLSQVIHNGFDIDRFRPNHLARTELRRLLNISQNVPVIGMVARYDPIKRHHWFIEAAQIIVQKKPDVRFVLVGEGVDRNNTNLIRLINAFSLSQHFHLLGHQSCLPDIYPAFDIHTLSSYSEGFPNVIGEAMACGVPCVTTDVGDAATIIGNTGKLVPVGEPQGLANAWMDILGCSNEEKMRLNDAARNRIVDCFDIRKIVGQYASFYKGLLEHVT